VIVEETFSLSVPADTPAAIRIEAGIKDEDENTTGDGYYISATVQNNRRYYGVLIDQAALKAASLLHFQDESRSLDLNRRMKFLREQQQSEQMFTNQDNLSQTEGPPQKKTKLECSNGAMPSDTTSRIVQKFRYVESTSTECNGLGYRLLLATFTDVAAAAEDDTLKAQKIHDVCQSGGGFVEQYYYQYQVLESSLASTKIGKPTDVGLRTSMGFQDFLLNTPLPIWFPLSNLQISQHKILSMLQMKKNNKGNIIWDSKVAESKAETSSSMTGSHIPIEPRACYRIGIIGGGIAGLACALEIFRQAEQDKIDVEVVLIEGRSRLGGRIATDQSTFKFEDGDVFPVDLGASWIHGIDHNPLAALAKDVGVDFVTASEEVKMLGRAMNPVNSTIDEKMGKLFDDLLDEAADDVWDTEDSIPDDSRTQKAVRWYAAVLDGSDESHRELPTSDAPTHRKSSDVSIDHSIGQAVAKNIHREFERFGQEHHALLLWNIKNIEYALGANISDLSMKFWDSDERHAFEGDHVLLKQGYASIIDHLENKLKNKGDKFQCILDCPVKKVEYARKTTTLPYTASETVGFRKLVEMSDSCSVSAGVNNTSYRFDFLVSTLPLGVLKASTSTREDEIGKVEFDPPLPFSKIDAIENTGFGLLNKVYLQFTRAFWRIQSIFDEDQTLFGNASGVNPHHYLFHDIGKSLGKDCDAPAVLMSLISGKEAVSCELVSDNELIEEVIHTLRTLFTADMVPDPIAFKVTRWGADQFARGSYTFLPPGASDQDFHILQSPINGNGDSLVLEGSETMRLFWAGEHTTALHPSMAHGAMMSGIRAAKEVLSTIQFNYNDERSGFEKMIPLSIFRRKNPNTMLQCNLCNEVGSRVREGSLLAFQKGSRQVLVHNNCGENSPEVEVRDGQWKSVIKAINRGKQINCCMCGRVGATIGCTQENCFRSFHFSCAEDTGYRFERDGKTYFCDLHRTYDTHEETECDRISIAFYRSKKPTVSLKCAFCGEVSSSDAGRQGKIMAFQQKSRQLLVHDKCARYTNLMETLEDPKSTNEFDFQNLFEVFSRAKICSMCSEGGATIQCTDGSCDCHFHYPCAEDTGWRFDRKGLAFKCENHRSMNGFRSKKITMDATSIPHGFFSSSRGGPFSHNLFQTGGGTVVNSPSKILRCLDASAVNSQMGRSRLDIHQQHITLADEDEEIEVSSEEEVESICNPMLQVLSRVPSKICSSKSTVIQLTRKSITAPWQFTFILQDLEPMTTVLCVELNTPIDSTSKSSLYVESINGNRIGKEINHLLDAMAMLESCLELNIGVNSN